MYICVSASEPIKENPSVKSRVLVVIIWKVTYPVSSPWSSAEEEKPRLVNGIIPIQHQREWKARRQTREEKGGLLEWNSPVTFSTCESRKTWSPAIFPLQLAFTYKGQGLNWKFNPTNKHKEERKRSYMYFYFAMSFEIHFSLFFEQCWASSKVSQKHFLKLLILNFFQNKTIELSVWEIFS